MCVGHGGGVVGWVRGVCESVYPGGIAAAMAAYVRGLLGEVEHKNGWTLAEAAGEGGPQGMQRLLNFYAWDVDGVRDDVRAVVAEALGDPERGVLIVDETGFVKKGA
jgi:SRSO17 transposase